MRPYPLNGEELLDDVGRELEALTDGVRMRFGGLTSEQLVWQPGPERWGVGQCLVHLVRLNELYRPRMAAALELGRTRGWKAGGPLRGSWFGRWFTAAVGPGGGKRVRTPPLFRPRKELVTQAPVASFIEEQRRLRGLVEEARGLDLDRIRVVSPASSFLRFRVGDAFRILVEHEKRHMLQAEAVVGAEGFPR